MTKPILTGFLLSNDLQQLPGEQGVGVALMNPLNTLILPFIPNTFSFAVSFGFTNIDITKPHKLNFFIKDPNGNIVANAENINLPAEENTNNLPIEAQGFNFNFNLRNVQFMVEGKYTATVHVDSYTVAEFPCYVYTNNKMK